MNNKLKDFYKAPSTIIYEIKPEGMICVSLQDYIWHDILEDE